MPRPARKSAAAFRVCRAAVVAICLLAVPASASAKVSLSNAVAHPIAPGAKCNSGAAVDAPAGGHSDFCVAFDVTTPDNDDVKRLVIHLPPGINADPTAATKCSQADFTAAKCAASAKVGSVSASVKPDVLNQTLPLKLTVGGDVFNLEPNPTEPARLGLSINPVPGLFPPLLAQSTTRARLTDYGADSVSDSDLPRTITLLGVDAHVTVTHMALTLWGAKAAHPSLAKAFQTNPTVCRPATATIEVTAWDGPGDSKADTFTPTDCEHVPFTPSLEVGPAQIPSDTPTGFTATLKVPATVGDDRAQSSVRRVEIALPPGMSVSAGLANGLTACTDEQFGLTEDRAPRCPASSEIGDVTFVTAAFGAISGKVYFGTPEAAGKLRNFISVEDPRARVKSIGTAVVDPQTGQLTSIIEDAPPVPFEALSFSFRGGPHALLSSPSTCGTHTTVARLTPSSGGPTATVQATNQVVDCPAPTFTPTLTITSSNNLAGQYTTMTSRIERPDRQVHLQRATFSMPSGLVASLGSVPQCPIALARAGSCADYSRIGTAQVVVGNGPEPVAMSAGVYLTEGFDGAVAGLAIAAPAAVGPIDLGKIVTLAKFNVGPDGSVYFDTGDIPQSLLGIPTIIRALEVTIDRPNLLINPSSCKPLVAHGVFTGVGGAQATSDATYQVTGCDRQPYAPKLTATITGQVKKGGRPTVTTSITQKPGEATTRHVELTMPADLAPDLGALARACSAEQADANACPPSSVIGSVVAETPLLPGELHGTVRMVKSKQSILPELLVELAGPVPLRMHATAVPTKDGRSKTVIDGMADVPVSRLELSFVGGKNGLIEAVNDLCSKPQKLDALFISHGDVTRKSTVTANVACGAASASAKLKASVALTGVKRKRPALRVKVTSPSPLRELRVALPSQLSAAKGFARAAKLLAGGKGVKKPSLRLSGRTLVIKLPAAGTRSPDLRLAAGGLRLIRAVKAGTRLSYTITGTTTKKAKLTTKVAATARA